MLQFWPSHFLTKELLWKFFLLVASWNKNKVFFCLKRTNCYWDGWFTFCGFQLITLDLVYSKEINTLVKFFGCCISFSGCNWIPFSDGRNSGKYWEEKRSFPRDCVAMMGNNPPQSIPVFQSWLSTIFFMAVRHKCTWWICDFFWGFIINNNNYSNNNNGTMKTCKPLGRFPLTSR